MFTSACSSKLNDGDNKTHRKAVPKLTRAAPKLFRNCSLFRFLPFSNSCESTSFERLAHELLFSFLFWFAHSLMMSHCFSSRRLSEILFSSHFVFRQFICVLTVRCCGPFFSVFVSRAVVHLYLVFQ